MKELISFPAVLAAFIVGSAILHWLVRALGIHGLPSFLIFCIPMLCVISYTTAREGESFFAALLRTAAWGYGFILSVATVAWLLS
jgi:hypothetical protein